MAGTGWIVVFGAIAAAVPAQAQDKERGMELYTACASCHGGDGRATTMAQYPKIGGQNEAYLVEALKAYRDGRRQGTFASMMAPVAKPLSDTDIADLAAYIAALE